MTKPLKKQALNPNEWNNSPQIFSIPDFQQAIKYLTVFFFPIKFALVWDIKLNCALQKMFSLLTSFLHVLDLRGTQSGSHPTSHERAGSGKGLHL